jgi:UDP-N-acetylmuramyl pentapeptide synthase
VSNTDSDRVEGVDLVDTRAVRAALRDLADAVHGAPPRRSWAVLGEMDVPAELDAEDRAAMTGWVVSHDELGRLAVRLDIGQVICVGTSRAVHGLHQGAVMEGSWGSEAVLVPTPQAAAEILDAQLGEHDVVLVMGGRDLGLTDFLNSRVGRRSPGAESA